MESSEVICISSDDENIQQDESNRKQISAKRLASNHSSCIKVELTSHESGEIINCAKKRKISEIDNKDSNFESNTKMLDKEQIIKEHNQEECSNELINVQKDKERTLLKPKLVIKESKPFSPTEQDIFPMFISLCLQKDRSEDMKLIINKLKRCYERLDSEYANSEAFISFINEKRDHIMSSKVQLYSHIVVVMNEMKKRCKGKSMLLLNNKKCTSSLNKLQSSNSNLPTSSVHMDNVHNINVSEGNDIKKEGNEKHNAMYEKLKLLEKAMDKCQKYIKKLEESEVNFTDEDNSSYMKLNKYKQKMVELYNKYCQYTGGDIDAGRQYLRPKHLSTTGIVTLDHAITNFINSKLSKLHKLKKIGTFTDAVIFPDYKDILDCIEKYNELNNLGLDTKEQHRMAKKAFIKLGEYLQRSRQADYWDTFSLFLEGKDDDPALKDHDLARKLIENKREGEKRLANVFEEYVKKQESSKNRLISSETSSNEEDEEEIIENEDEDNIENSNISEEEGSLIIDRGKSNSENEEKEEEKKEEDVSTDKNEIIIKEKSISDKVETNNLHENEVLMTDKRVNNKIEMNNSNGNEVSMKEKSINNKTEINNFNKNNVSMEEKSINSEVDINNFNDNEVSIKEKNIISKVGNNNSDIIEIDKDFHASVSDTLKDVANDHNLKKTNQSNDVNIPDCNSKAQISKENDGMVLSTVGIDVTCTKVDVDRIKEDEVNITTEDSTDNKPSEQEKPLLRVRSFARHPITWKDGTEKIESDVIKNVPTILFKNNIVDLTAETPDKNNVAINDCTNVAKSQTCHGVIKKLKTVVVTVDKDILKLKNISNCSDKLNPQVTDRNGTTRLEDIKVVSSRKQPTIVTAVKLHTKQKPHPLFKLHVNQNSPNINIQPKKTSKS